MKTKKQNIWKGRTIILSILAIVLIFIVLFQMNQEEEKENKRLCSIIEGTPAWISSQGFIMGYGVIGSGGKENQTIINDTILTENLIEHKVKFLYSDNCYYCQIQKEILGEENLERLRKRKLLINCGEINA